MKQEMAALIIGGIMVSSVAGYAVINVTSRGNPRQNVRQIPNIVHRELEKEEKVYVLRTGRVLIESYFPENCTPCQENNKKLEDFVSGFKDFAVLEEVPANKTEVKMIGKNGDIEEIENFDRDSLMDKFCELAMKQPTECLLREI